MLLACGLLVSAIASVTKGTVMYPYNESLEDTFRQCLISQAPGNLGHCMGVGTISKLQSLDGSPEFDLVDGVTLTKDEQQEYRDGYSFGEGDPASFRTILDSFNHVFSRRNLQWNMDFLYPGLTLRVAPSVGTAGHLEFALDSQREAVNVQNLKEAGTGRLLARQFLVPFLLGFKFNVASILPILFGVLALLAKKALVVSKLALLATSAFGLGTLLFGQNNNYQNYQNGAHYHPSFGGAGGYHGYRQPHDEYLQQSYYYRDGGEAQQDPVNIYGDIAKTFQTNDEKNEGRNFAWSDDEKKTKEKPI